MAAGETPPTGVAPGAEPARRRRGPLGWLVLVLVQLVLVALLFEGALHVLQATESPAKRWLYMPGLRTEFDSASTVSELLEQAGYPYGPNQVVAGVRLDSQGFRTPEYGVQKRPGTLRLLAMGDSFTFSSGSVPYPTMWHQRVGDLLDEVAESDVEIISLGIPGVGPAFQLRLWQLEASRLDADLVVLAFFVGNDFIDSRLLADEAPLVDRVARVSLAVRLVRNKLRYAEVQERWASERRERRGGDFVTTEFKGYDPDKPSFPFDEYDDLEHRRMAICLRQNLPRMLEDRTGVGRYVTSLRDEVVATGARFLVMIIPDHFQVDDEFRRGMLERVGDSEDRYALFAPQRFLREWFEREGIEYLDLLDLFREQPDPAGLYRPRDTHWSIRGNGLAAGALHEHIVELIRDEQRRDG